MHPEWRLSDVKWPLTARQLGAYWLLTAMQSRQKMRKDVTEEEGVTYSIWVLSGLQQGIELSSMHVGLLLSSGLVHLCLVCQASLCLINVVLQVHSSSLLPFTLLCLYQANTLCIVHSIVSAAVPSC